jgi:hypothetical protein
MALVADNGGGAAILVDRPTASDWETFRVDFRLTSRASFGWLAVSSQQCFSLTPIQHQPPDTSQPAVFFSHNKSAPATSHQPAERDQFTLLRNFPTLKKPISTLLSGHACAAVEDQRDDLQLEGEWRAVLGRQQHRCPCGDGHHTWAKRTSANSFDLSAESAVVGTLFVWTYQQNQQPSSSVFLSQQTSKQCFQHNKPAKRTGTGAECAGTDTGAECASGRQMDSSCRYSSNSMHIHTTNFDWATVH